MAKKLNREAIKTELEGLEEEDKQYLKELLGVKGDQDIIGEVLKLTKRLEELEKTVKTPKEKKGFFSFLGE